MVPLLNSLFTRIGFCFFPPCISSPKPEWPMTESTLSILQQNKRHFRLTGARRVTVLSVSKMKWTSSQPDHRVVPLQNQLFLPLQDTFHLWSYYLATSCPSAQSFQVRIYHLFLLVSYISMGTHVHTCSHMHIFPLFNKCSYFLLLL